VTALLAPATVTAAAEDRPQATVPAADGPVAVGIACWSTRSCTPSHGGAFMATWRNSCTAGLPVRVRRGTRWYLLTAGHCVAGARGATWWQSGRMLGRGSRWEYGTAGTDGRRAGTDIGVVRITANTATWRARSRVVVARGRTVHTRPIRTVRTARLGERVCVTAGRSGATKCGVVVAPSTSLTYASPGLLARRVSGLALVAGVCLRPGDSGSPVFTGSALVGIAVARAYSGCSFWYARAADPLRRYGLVVAG
jgi:hypothetical protein